MNMKFSYSRFFLAASLCSILSACNDSDNHDHDDHSHDTNNQATEQSSNQTLKPGGIDFTLFKEGTFIKEPEIIDCITSTGTETTCYKLVTLGAPTGREIGHYCPRHVSDGADSVGVWFDKSGKGEMVDLTGEFIANLAEYYDDPNWKIADSKTGKIRYTETKEACLAAARPDVDPDYQQNCIECLMSYLDDDFFITYTIPTQPIIAKQTSRLKTVGIALDGAELSAPAPIDAILGAYTIAAFDDCGGHVNPRQGYHYHSSNGCTDKIVDDGKYAPLIGYAADGFPIYAWKDAHGNEAEGLDECRGISDTVRGYHYRAASPSENAILPCLRGESIPAPQDPHSAHNVSAHNVNAPTIQSPSPVIYLADNLDEKDKLGWCIDTEGRGFSDKLQSHSCKPNTGQSENNDTQFSYHKESGQIRSVPFEGKCITLNNPDDKVWPLGLIDCVAGDSLQNFIYKPDTMEIQLHGDTSKCVAVAQESIIAGPYMSRDLIYVNCESIENKYKQWVIKK